ncbi:hypothetical protein GQ53DRAFT_156715 [Thozetella sp. PMI_491]|nr:hypothetical protein GQ53DRAFT_156715 [Thozetella sp. PMI_491]
MCLGAGLTEISCVRRCHPLLGHLTGLGGFLRSLHKATDRTVRCPFHGRRRLPLSKSNGGRAGACGLELGSTLVGGSVSSLGYSPNNPFFVVPTVGKCITAVVRTSGGPYTCSRRVICSPRMHCIMLAFLLLARCAMSLSTHSGRRC